MAELAEIDPETVEELESIHLENLEIEEKNRYNRIQIRKFHNSAITPTRATQYSAGLDLYCPKDVVLRQGGTILINLELGIDIPYGHFGKIEGKSSLAYYHNISVGAGVIDFDYRGRIEVLLFNHGPEHFLIDRGDQIAQIVIQPCILPIPVLVQRVSGTSRTEGFGANSGYK